MVDMKAGSSVEYEDDWRLFRSVKIRTNYKVNLIDELSHLVFEDEFRGESVRWSYDKLEQAAIISNKLIEGGRYVEFGKTVLQLPSGQLTPPEPIRDKVEGGMQVGDTVYFLASENMLESDTASAFLLTSDQGMEGLEALDIEPVQYV
jgi:hypothetical protein